MRKHKSHITDSGLCFGCGLIPISLSLCLLLSCANNDETELSDGDDSCRATLRLDVTSFDRQGGDSARSVAGNTDEDRVRDLWVFQYNAQTGASLKDPVYISASQLNGDTQDITIDFTQNDPGESSIVCVVANTHDENWTTDDLGQTLDAFKTHEGLHGQALPDEVSQPFLSSNLGANGGYTIPMYGESDEMVIASKAYIRIPLVRMFAKVEVYVDPSYPHEMEMSIDGVTYSNIPLYSRVKEIENGSEYPVGDESWESWTLGKADDYILYLPENIQGVVEGMSEKKPTSTDPIPERALAIKIDMAHPNESAGDGADAGTHIHTYTVYPGMNMDNDFNIKRNHIYNVAIKIVSDPSKDNL